MRKREADSWYSFDKLVCILFFIFIFFNFILYGEKVGYGAADSLRFFLREKVTDGVYDINRLEFER